AVGALNFISGERGFHRRDALWQVERAARGAGPLLEGMDEAVAEAIAEPIAEPIEKPSQKIKSEENTPKVAAESMAALAGAAATGNGASPLLQMTAEERLVADFLGTGM